MVPREEQPRPAAAPDIGLRPRQGWDRKRIAEIVFLILVVGAAVLIRLWPIWQVHFWDETVYLQNAEVICCGKHNYSELASRPPLLSLLYAGVFKVWHHVYAASLLVAALNGLGALFLYWAGKALFGRVAGGISALLLTFSPFFVETGNSLLTDNPALSLTLLAFCVVLKGLTSDRPAWFALAGFLNALAGLMRFTSLITLFVFPFFLLWPRRRWASLGLFAAGVLLGFGPYLFWSQSEYGSLFSTLETARRNVGGSVEPRSFFVDNFGKIFPWLSLAGIALWLIALLWGTSKSREGVQGREAAHQDRLHTVPRWAPNAILSGWAALVFAYFSVLPHKELRYLIPLAAPWFLLSGGGLAVLTQGRTRWTRAAGVAVLLLCMGYNFAPSLRTFGRPFIEPYISEEKRAADYLNQQSGNKDELLYLNYNYPVFAYYTQLPIRVLQEEDMSFYQRFPWNMPSDGYLIIYKNLKKQPRPIWADVNRHFRRLREFPSLVVYSYQRSPTEETAGPEAANP
jgi:4-amino-4-deoxy-L-arabinose transferase-like glycosyltransferase